MTEAVSSSRRGRRSLAEASRLLARYRRVSLPTTAAGIEVMLAGVFVAFRLLNVVQTLVALPGGLSSSRRPVEDGVAVLVFLVETVVVTVAIYRRGAYRSTALGWLDGAVGVGLLAETWRFTYPDSRFSNWADWGYPVTMSVALGAGIVFRRWQQTAIPTIALMLVYLATTVPHSPHNGGISTALTNACSYPIAAGLAWMLSSYLRRVGADADVSRATAAALATTLERERHRPLLHDHVTVLDVLSREEADDRLVQAARVRAASGSAQIRAFLRGEAGPPRSLAATLGSVTEEFPHLALSQNLVLADAELSPALTAALASAVRTLLDNVAWHAKASQVVVHAVTSCGSWDVSVTDDGVGYDPSSVTEGFGLATQVRGALAAFGGEVTVLTAPGRGTCVQLSGRGPSHEL